MKLLKKAGLVLFAGVVVWVVWSRYTVNKNTNIQYQTATAEKKTLVVSVSGSGTVASLNSVVVSTQASGVVKDVYVKDGDSVRTGDPVVSLDLDLIGNQRYMASLASYQGAKNSLETARANLYTSQNDLFTNWETYYDLATSGEYQNSDGSPNVENRKKIDFTVDQNTWLNAEAKYKIAQSTVTQAQHSLSSAWSSLQQSSPIIYAPITGKISGMSLQSGNVIGSSTSTSGSASSVKIANVETDGLPSISLDLSEIDIPKIAIGDKATVTLDAIADKTFTGVVVSIDTVGSVSSGVSTYPVVIRLDTGSPEILPNMSASANIITETKHDVVVVPSSAVTGTGETAAVSVMKNGTPTDVPVTVGLTSDMEAEIVSGVSVGDVVVTGTVNTSQQTQSSSSPFSAFGGGRTGGAQMRTIQ